MPTTIKFYLAAYNAIAFIFWGAYLSCFLYSGFQINSLNLLLLNIAQGMAVLEIFHVLLKWVKSPLVSTTVQVFSRLLVLLLVNIFILNHADSLVFNIGLITVSFAWSITELVRYSLYFLSLFDKQPAALIWMRYSFFIVLYPLGVTGEWFILLTPMIADGITLGGYMIFLIVGLVAYIYYFPVLYKYMWKQRKSKLQE